LASLGDPLSLDEATGLLGVEQLAALETAGLIVVAESEDDTFSPVHLAHPLYAELISSQTPVSRAREHRLCLAALLSECSPADPADAVRVALWLTEAGGPVPPSILLDAARAANTAGVEVGGRFAQLALDAGAGPEAAMLLSRSHHVHGRASEAEIVLAAIEGAIEDPALPFEYLRERTSLLQWGLDRSGQALELLDRASAWWPDPAWASKSKSSACPSKRWQASPARRPPRSRGR
jgi:hypothetical protein